MILSYEIISTVLFIYAYINIHKWTTIFLLVISMDTAFSVAPLLINRLNFIWHIIAEKQSSFEVADESIVLTNNANKFTFSFIFVNGIIFLSLFFISDVFVVTKREIMTASSFLYGIINGSSFRLTKNHKNSKRILYIQKNTRNVFCLDWVNAKLVPATVIIASAANVVSSNDKVPLIWLVRGCKLGNKYSFDYTSPPWLWFLFVNPTLPISTSIPGFNIVVVPSLFATQFECVTKKEILPMSTLSEIFTNFTF